MNAATQFNSTDIAALIFLPCAPIAMLICYWLGKRKAQRIRRG